MVSPNEGTMSTDRAETVEIQGSSDESSLAKLRDYSERSQHLVDMRPELTQKHPNQWVALTEARVLVIADSIEELVSKILELGERPESAAAKYLNTQPPRVIPG